jgi:hypothetical protein
MRKGKKNSSLFQTGEYFIFNNPHYIAENADFEANFSPMGILRLR